MQRKVIFLDRDGVLNEDIGYLYKIEDCRFTEGVFEACAQFVQAGYELIIVTNQSGIGRGYYSEQDFHHLMVWMSKQFQAHGVDFLDIYFCPHHPTQAQGDYQKICECRKPRPGMLLQAIKDYDIDAEQSWLVGDGARDIEAAYHAGIGHTALLGGENKDTMGADCQIRSLLQLVPYLHQP